MSSNDLPMSTVAAWSLAAALCSCAIDDRSVEVRPADCASPPAGGIVSDFPTARLGRCPATTCPGAFENSPTVTLGKDGVEGLVFPYHPDDTVVLALGLTGDLGSVRDPASALRVVASYDALARVAPTLVGGFAIQFSGCLDASAYAAVQFRIDGTLAACPLRFATRGAGTGAPGTICPLAECSADPSVAVAVGLTTVPLSVAAGAGARPAPAPGDAGGVAGGVLFGLQWELGLPSDGGRQCSADFTIDDIRLVAAP